MTDKSLAFEGRPDPAGSSEMPAASTFAIHDQVMAHKPDMEMVLRREIERLIAAAAWRPIETAPKDGTKVLGFAPDPLIDDPEFRVVVMWWRADQFRDSEWKWRCTQNDAAAGHPTHWMPLPEPPERNQSSVAKVA